MSESTLPKSKSSSRKGPNHLATPASPSAPVVTLHATVTASLGGKEPVAGTTANPAISLVRNAGHISLGAIGGGSRKL